MATVVVKEDVDRLSVSDLVSLSLTRTQIQLNCVGVILGLIVSTVLSPNRLMMMCSFVMVTIMLLCVFNIFSKHFYSNMSYDYKKVIAERHKKRLKKASY